jgi:hypothetical protein
MADEDMRGLADDGDDERAGDAAHPRPRRSHRAAGAGSNILFDHRKCLCCEAMFTLEGRPEAAWSYAVCNEDCRDEWLREHPDADFPDPHAARVTLTTDAAVWKHISNAVRATRGRSATAADVASDAVLREVSPPACPGIARAADDEVA